MISVVKELSDRQVLIKRGEHYFVVSQSIPEIQPVEVLVFPSDQDGTIKDYTNIDGEVGVTLKSFLPALIERGDFSPGWDIPW